jgi:two-component system osmolarity sensor histidine kinase EnvZ
MSFAWLKRYMPRSLYGRAALILALPVITIQLVVSVVFIQRHFEDVTEQMTRNVVLELRLIRRLVDAAPLPAAVRASVDELAEGLDIDTKLPAAPILRDRRLFYDLSGRVVIRELYAVFPEITGIDLSDIRRVAMTMETPHGVLELSFPRYRVSASNPHQLLVLMVFVSLVMTVIAAIYMRNQLRPVKRLAQAAEAFGRGRTLPFKPSGATEIRAAGSAFLDMRNRIERQTQARTMMLSGVSHDLRTPLTRMRLGLSMLEEEAETAALLADVREMEAIIDTFLDFARVEALDDAEPSDPCALLEALVEGAARQGRTVELGQRPPEGTQISYRPQAVRRALENLLGNALRHGSRARVSAELFDRALVFCVEDDGPGIPAEAREEAMKPFQRLDAARNRNRGGSGGGGGGGVGLGLAIAADIARQHGGSLRLGDSDDLGGLRADLILAR